MSACSFVVSAHLSVRRGRKCRKGRKRPLKKARIVSCGRPKVLKKEKSSAQMDVKSEFGAAESVGMARNVCSGKEC